MAVLRADLAGKEDELLGAIAVVVLVDDDLEPQALDIAEAEVGDLHALELVPGDGDAGLFEQDHGGRPRLRDVFGCHGPLRTQRTTLLPAFRGAYVEGPAQWLVSLTSLLLVWVIGMVMPAAATSMDIWVVDSEVTLT